MDAFFTFVLNRLTGLGPLVGGHCYKLHLFRDLIRKVMAGSWGRFVVRDYIRYLEAGEGLDVLGLNNMTHVENRVDIDIGSNCNGRIYQHPVVTIIRRQ